MLNRIYVKRKKCKPIFPFNLLFVFFYFSVPLLCSYLLLLPRLFLFSSPLLPRPPQNGCFLHSYLHYLAVFLSTSLIITHHQPPSSFLFILNSSCFILPRCNYRLLLLLPPFVPSRILIFLTFLGNISLLHLSLFLLYLFFVFRFVSWYVILLYSSLSPFIISFFFSFPLFPHSFIASSFRLLPCNFLFIFVLCLISFLCSSLFLSPLPLFLSFLLITFHVFILFHSIRCLSV